MEEKRSRHERVSEDFSRYIGELQRHVRENTGSNLSRTEITSIIAAMRPSIIFPENGKQKKKGGVFDF